MKPLAFFMFLIAALSVPCHAQTSHSVTLSATPSSSSVAGYNVYRSTTHGGPYALLGSTFTPTFQNNNLVGGATYYYVMTAYVTGAESAYSNEVVAVIPPDSAPPPNTLPPLTISCTVKNNPQCTIGRMTSRQTVNVTVTDPATGQVLATTTAHHP